MPPQLVCVGGSLLPCLGGRDCGVWGRRGARGRNTAIPAYLLCDIHSYMYIVARVSRVGEQWDFVVTRRSYVWGVVFCSVSEGGTEEGARERGGRSQHGGGVITAVRFLSEWVQGS